MKRYLHRLIVAIFILSGISANADGGKSAIFKIFDIRSESTRPKFTKIYCDRSGQIWTGTDHGLFKFDGSDFVKIPGTDSVIFKTVTSIFQDHNGVIWAGYSSGKILKIIHNRFTIFNPEEGFPKVAVTGFAEDKNNQIYFCTNGEGVYTIERNRMYNINEDDGLSDNYCYGIVSLEDGSVCTGTDAGVNFIRFQNGKKSITVFNSSHELPDDIVRAVLPAGNGKIWIGMQDKGILLYDYVNKKIIQPTPTSWKYGPVVSLEIIDQELWIVTEQNGIIIYKENNRFEKYPVELGRTYKSLNLIKDLENNVWFAESIHLIRTAGNKIFTLNNPPQFPLKFVHCILSSRDGSIYFSPDVNLARLQTDPDGTQHYKMYIMPDQKTDIVSLYEDPAGFIWIGTMGNGVYRLNPKSGNIRQVFASKSIESASILSINGNGDELWTAGFNGANKYRIRNMDSENVQIVTDTSFTYSVKLNNDYVYEVFTDTHNRTWFATDENGVYYLENNKIKNLAVPGNTVHSFTEDKLGRVWIGTAEAGIIVFSDDTIIRLEPKDGLSSPSVTSLHCTNYGQVIMVYDNGFDVINPNDFSIIYHSSEEGFSDLNPSINSITEKANGEIYIGTEKGIILYSPASDNQLKYPQTILNSISIFLEDIDYTNTNKFAYDENNLRFDYSGLWYTDPKRINYFYMLEGYSTKWQQTKDRTITFPKLAPGKYTFRLVSSLTPNHSNLKEIKYSFTILTPFWQRWWFRSAIAAILAIVIFLMILQRDRRIRREDREQKEKIEFQFQTLKSQVNPHFLFNSFNTLISVIEKQPQLAVEYVEKLSEFFRNIVNYREKNLIPLSEELDLLENYIFIQKKRYGDNLIVINKINEDAVRKLLIPPLCLQLLAENAIKHNAVSRETPLTIQLEIVNGKIKISNNLNTKYSTESSSGFGLQNIMSRFKLLTDEVVVIQKTEDTFSVELPLITKATA